MDSLDRESRLADQLGRSPGRKQADILVDQALGQIQQACFVVDREDSWECQQRQLAN
jgi:hypothetical protein